MGFNLIISFKILFGIIPVSVNCNPNYVIWRYSYGWALISAMVNNIDLLIALELSSGIIDITENQ